MPRTITITDIDAANFVKFFRGFSITVEQNPAGGIIVNGTLNVALLDAEGEQHGTASHTMAITGARLVALRDLILNNWLPPLKAEQGL